MWLSVPATGCLRLRPPFTMDRVYCKSLSPTLKMKLVEGKLLFQRRHLEKLTKKTVKMERAFLKMMFRKIEKLNKGFECETNSNQVLTKLGVGHTRFFRDQYGRKVLWIRPIDRSNNFNMTKYEFEAFIYWRSLLSEYFELVSMIR